MNKPRIHPEPSRRICAVIVNTDLKTIQGVEPLADLFEVRIDMIGDGWQEMVKKLKKPWIATNRTQDEGGKWQGTEARRIEGLLQAIGLGAQIVDIEFRTKNLENIVPMVKKRVKCLLSFHDFEKTPPYEELKKIVQGQIKAGADICKVVTTAKTFEDNLSVLQLIADFPNTKVVSFAMGTEGQISRVLSPLAGADFTYASIATGKESAPGQITINQMKAIYGALKQ